MLTRSSPQQMREELLALFEQGCRSISRPSGWLFQENTFNHSFGSPLVSRNLSYSLGIPAWCARIQLRYRRTNTISGIRRVHQVHGAQSNGSFKMVA